MRKRQRRVLTAWQLPIIGHRKQGAEKKRHCVEMAMKGSASVPEPKCGPSI